MINRIVKIAALTVVTMCAMTSCKNRKEITIQNPLPVAFGDPFLLRASNGEYYMYGTTDNMNGFGVYSSTDLITWIDRGQAYRGAEPGSWTTDCFWAPEVYEREGKYYMFFSSNWKENPNNDLEVFRIGVAVADSPTGPFVDMYDRPIFDPGYPIIDANVLWDNDGRVYLYYSRCCYKHPVESELAEWARAKGMYDEIEESWVYGIEMKSDFSGVIGEPVALLTPPATMSDPQTEWESRSVTAGEINRRWTEGSYIVKRGNTYYMMYSANFYGGQYYAVGYATAESPLGPFTKSPDNPVLQKNTDKGGDVTGTGHNMIHTLPSGEMLCVYHGRTTKTGNRRMVFIDRMEITPEGSLIVHGPTTTLWTMPK
jgi:beta-xylosidase